MKKGMIVVVMAAFCAMCTSAVAETVHVYGANARAKAVASYLNSNGGDAIVHPTKEIKGSLNGKSWPGVNVTTSSIGDGTQGVFVPVSNGALRTGLCDDQKRLLQSYIPAKPQRQVTAVTSAPVATSGMRVIQSGDKCDERSFAGMVPNSVLESTGGRGADAIETHYRPGKSQQYKAKRGRVMSDGVFYPMVWMRDGSCVRIYAATPITAAHLQTLTNAGEQLTPTTATDIAVKDPGTHITEATFVVK